MNQLILVEGIPGSGKTTISAKIKDHLESLGKKAVLYNEGDQHPVDLAWIASVPINEYEGLLRQYPEFKERLELNTKRDQDYAYVTYTKLGLYPQENDLMIYLEDHEVYNARVSLDLFQSLHLNRWSSFGKQAPKNTITIFECAFLQNHINELLAYHNKDEQYIRQYMKDLMETVKDLNPKLIYLSQPNIRETITRVSNERKTADKTKGTDWIDLVIDYIENCPYGKKHQLKGFEGVLHFFKKRKEVELKVIEDLNIEKVIIENNDYNWEEVVQDILKQIEYS